MQICQSHIQMNNQEKEQNEKLLRNFVEKQISLEQIKEIFRRSNDPTMLLVSLELIVKYVINNSECQLHKRVQGFQARNSKCYRNIISMI